MTAWLPFNSAEPVIDEKSLLEIGRIMVAWSAFENLLYTDMIELLRIAERNNIELNVPPEIPFTFKRRLKLWKRLCRAVYADIELYRDISAEVGAAATIAAKRRNMIVHGLLQNTEKPQDDIYDWLAFSNKKGVTFEREQFNLAKFQNLTALITKLGDYIAGLGINRSLGVHHIKEEPS